MLHMDIAQYRNTPIADTPVCFDRGVGDAVAFLFLQGALTSAEGEAYVTEFRYHELVFFFPPWREIYHPDTERDHSFAHAVAVGEQVRTWYRQWHYTIVGGVLKLDICYFRGQTEDACNLVSPQGA
jgi:predicted ATPase